LFIHGRFVEPNYSTTLYKPYLGKNVTSVTEDNYQFFADYAYQVQKQTQFQVENFVYEWVCKTGIKKVCITGGYGLNVVTNGFLLKSDRLKDVEFFFEPLADDTGNSIGAAMHLYRSMSLDSKINKLKDTFFHGDIEELKIVGQECTTTDIANFLMDQKTVAVFNGLAESGPRALGNRSILFDARNKDAKKMVNIIKNREWYRPFAAMILEENFDDYFETHGITKSEYMCVSYQSKTDKIPGVVHVDNSCRIQTVSKEIPHIYSLLKEFDNLTGVPVLLNTSFNMAGEALIETQTEAIDCFYNTKIDVLWFPEIGKCLIK
jgi:carbamoyltransferase